MNIFVFLSITKINDGHVDCIGGTDEMNLCGNQHQWKYRQEEKEFSCQVNNSRRCLTISDLCDDIAHHWFSVSINELSRSFSD